MCTMRHISEQDLFKIFVHNLCALCADVLPWQLQNSPLHLSISNVGRRFVYDLAPLRREAVRHFLRLHVLLLFES